MTRNHSKASERETFRSILERLRRAAADGSEDDASSPEGNDVGRATSCNPQLQQVLDRMSEPGTCRSSFAAERLARTYTEEHSARPSEHGPERPEIEAVAEELGLGSELTPADLARIRRAFALANHPDCVAPRGRDRATRRMMIANMLIDQALRGKSNRTR